MAKCILDLNVETKKATDKTTGKEYEFISLSTIVAGKTFYLNVQKDSKQLFNYLIEQELN